MMHKWFDGVKSVYPMTIMEHTPERCGFVADDRTPSNLLREGDLDDIIRRAVSLGLDAIQAMKMSLVCIQHNIWF